MIGFIWNQKHLNLVRSGDVTAFANRKVQAGATRAVKAAIALCRGEPLPDLRLEYTLEQALDPIAASRNNLKSFSLRPPNKR